MQTQRLIQSKTHFLLKFCPGNLDFENLEFLFRPEPQPQDPQNTEYQYSYDTDYGEEYYGSEDGESSFFAFGQICARCDEKDAIIWHTVQVFFSSKIKDFLNTFWIIFFRTKWRCRLGKTITVWQKVWLEWRKNHFFQLFSMPFQKSNTLSYISYLWAKSSKSQFPIFLFPKFPLDYNTDSVSPDEDSIGLPTSEGVTKIGFFPSVKPYQSIHTGLKSVKNSKILKHTGKVWIFPFSAQFFVPNFGPIM